MNKESSHLKTVMSYNKIGLKGNHTILNTKTKGTMIGTSRTKGNKGEAITNEDRDRAEKSHEKPRGSRRRLAAKSEQKNKRATKEKRVIGAKLV